ncbi:hypothetical protein CL653_01535 [bacterium]|nr:hypothetical protein [bacterium]|tara:strand:+ start:31 stop:564 length:534 start_codon:yes stop_codon:yes gene_type:complete
MTELNQENKKTISAFAAGLLVGALLVWIFTGDTNPSKEIVGTDMEESASVDENSKDTNVTFSLGTPDSTPTLTVGEGLVSVDGQSAGNTVILNSASFPTDDGWVVVRTYTDGQLGNILGAARYSKAESLVPTEVSLLTPTLAGKTYAVVFFSDDGNKAFNLDGDAQLDTRLNTFTTK